MTYKPLEERVDLGIVHECISSGFTNLDIILNGGFRTSATYLIAGIAKSGKSSLLMDIANFHLRKCHKVAFFDTELSEYEFTTRMAGIFFDHATSTVEKNPNIAKDWLDINKDKFFYSSLNDPYTGKEMSIEEMLILADIFVKQGVKIFCFDNLTTFSNKLTNGKQGWELLNNALDRVIKFAKKNRVTCFCVIHTKRGQTYKESPQGIKELVKSGSVDQIFTESITVVTKPSVDDIYGGSSKTHVDGAILVWRPLQFYPDQKLNRQTQLILEQFRNNPDGSVLMDFDGEKKIFTEVLTEEFAQKLFNSKENNEDKK